MAAIEEILRVVRLGGRVLIFVWALEQTGKRDFDKDVQDVFVPWAMPKKAEPKIKVKAPSRPQGVKKKDRKKPQMEGEEGEEKKEEKEVKETNASLPAETSVAVVAQALQEVSLDNKEGNQEEKPQEQEGAARSAPADVSTLASSSSSSSSTAQQPQESTAAVAAATSTSEAAPVYNRYYHLFQKGELEDLVTKTNKATIVQQGYDRDNWWCILEKTSN